MKKTTKQKKYRCINCNNLFYKKDVISTHGLPTAGFGFYKDKYVCKECNSKYGAVIGPLNPKEIIKVVEKEQKTAEISVKSNVPENVTTKQNAESLIKPNQKPLTPADVYADRTSLLYLRKGERDYNIILPIPKKIEISSDEKEKKYKIIIDCDETVMHKVFDSKKDEFFNYVMDEMYFVVSDDPGATFKPQGGYSLGYSTFRYKAVDCIVVSLVPLILETCYFGNIRNETFMSPRIPDHYNPECEFNCLHTHFEHNPNIMNKSRYSYFFQTPMTKRLKILIAAEIKSGKNELSEMNFTPTSVFNTCNIVQKELETPEKLEEAFNLLNDKYTKENLGVFNREYTTKNNQ